jgi:uncharacterized protein YbcI
MSWNVLSEIFWRREMHEEKILKLAKIEYFHSYASPSNVRIVKSWRLLLDRHAEKRRKQEIHKMFGEKRLELRVFGRTKRWEDSIRMDFID